MFVGMIDRTDRKVLEWSLGLLDMIAKNVGHRLVPEKRNQPFSAGFVISKVLHIEPPRIKIIAGQRKARKTVIERDGIFIVARDGDDVQHASTQVNLA